MMQMYKAERIRKNYPRSRFLLDVPELELTQGSITGVVGENGNGKTTLLSIIAGLLNAEGEFSYFGESVHSGRQWELAKSKIAFIPQRIPRWYGTLIQNLKLKAALEGIRADRIDAELDEILDFLDLQKYKHLHWGEISTGFRLRFELARVLIGKPNLLVLDEPLANLDINTQQKFLSDLKAILRSKDYPTAVVLSSQQLHEIETVAGQMVFLREGRAIFSGERENLRTDADPNVFEFQVQDPAAFEQLMESKGFGVSKRGEYTQVSTPNDMDFNAILHQLINEGVQLQYARDISKSTKRLFHN